MRVLMVVKAYPQPSRSYDELVCTAGVLEDGSWVRIYPVPFTFLRFAKYQWIDLDLIRNTSDFRPESFRPVHTDLADMEIVENLDTSQKWAARKRYCCTDVYTSLTDLIAASRSPAFKSLATFKPTEVLDLVIENDEREWKKKWLDQLKQIDMFTQAPDVEYKPRIPIRKLPYKFRYKFVDSDGRESTLMIEDWEIGALYWNCLKNAEGDEEEALEKVREKYLIAFAKKDLHLFLGTTQIYHAKKAPNPFVVIGVFYPPIDIQYKLL